jgi:hypothetical protein
MKALILFLLIPLNALALTVDEDAAAKQLAVQNGAEGGTLIVCGKQSDPASRVQVNKMYLEKATIVLHPSPSGGGQVIVVECAE